MATSFYVYLPSNSKGEGNTTSSFTVQLPKKLEFNSSWLVALTNIIYPLSWPNLGTDEHQFIDIGWKNGGNARLYFPKMSYKSFSELSNTLDTILKEGSKHLCKIQKENEIIQVGSGKSETEQLEMASRAANRAWDSAKSFANQATDYTREFQILKNKILKLNSEDKQTLIKGINDSLDEIKQFTGAILNVLKAKNDTERLARQNNLIEAKRAADKAKEGEKIVLSMFDKIKKEYDKIKNRITQIEESPTKIAPQDKVEPIIRTAHLPEPLALKETLPDDVIQQSQENLRKRFEESKQRKLKKKQEDEETQMANANLEVERERIREENRLIDVECTEVTKNADYENLSSHIIFNFDQNQERFVIKLNKNHIDRVKLSRQLNYLLGFDTDAFSSELQVARYMPDLRAGINSIYIYSKDLITPSIIGDTTAPILRIITVKGNIGDIVEEHFINPQYFKLIDKTISEIKIELRTSSGRLIPFNYGDCILTLHFKKLPLL